MRNALTALIIGTAIAVLSFMAADREAALAAPTLAPVLTVPSTIETLHPAVVGDDNGDGTIDEDESGWDCRHMGNQICGPGATLPGGGSAIPGRYALFAVEDCQDVTYSADGRRAPLLAELPICA